jgi:hypothetical protein
VRIYVHADGTWHRSGRPTTRKEEVARLNMALKIVLGILVALIALYIVLYIVYSPT